MLFLFDIDGTLVRRMPPAHRMAICDAAREVYGAEISNEELGQTAGMTDTAIVRRALLAAGIALADIAPRLPAFFAAAADAYERHVPPDLRPYLTPHAVEALDWLAELGASLGLVTGNIERIAEVKLRAAGLDGYFGCGGFGDEAEAREALPPLALARARTVFRRDFEPVETYVVGDTPADVLCGAANGLRTVAVATGPVHALAELRACGAEFAFEDLRGLLTLELRKQNM